MILSANPPAIIGLKSIYGTTINSDFTQMNIVAMLDHFVLTIAVRPHVDPFRLAAGAVASTELSKGKSSLQRPTDSYAMRTFKSPFYALNIASLIIGVSFLGRGFWHMAVLAFLASTGLRLADAHLISWSAVSWSADERFPGLKMMTVKSYSSKGSTRSRTLYTYKVAPPTSLLMYLYKSQLDSGARSWCRIRPCCRACAPTKSA